MRSYGNSPSKCHRADAPPVCSCSRFLGAARGMVAMSWLARAPSESSEGIALVEARPCRRNPLRTPSAARCIVPHRREFTFVGGAQIHSVAHLVLPPSPNVQHQTRKCAAAQTDPDHIERVVMRKAVWRVTLGGARSAVPNTIVSCAPGTPRACSADNASELCG